MSKLVFTGERIVPGVTPLEVFREHEARYVFAERFVNDRLVIDVASGTGVGTHYLLKAGARGCIGLDLDLPSLSWAIRTYPGCSFVACDATAMCIGSGVADVIVSFETIEHLPDPRLFLTECQRVLRPGGIFICSTPNHTVYRWFGANPFHVHEFSAEEFLHLLEDFFTDCQVCGQSEVIYPLHIMKRVLKRVLVGALARLNLKDAVKKALGRRCVVAGENFEPGSWDRAKDIKVYTQRRVLKPTYLVAVARRGVQGRQEPYAHK